jgi:hypothetical protein
MRGGWLISRKTIGHSNRDEALMPPTVVKAVDAASRFAIRIRHRCEILQDLRPNRPTNSSIDNVKDALRRWRHHCFIGSGRIF